MFRPRSIGLLLAFTTLLVYLPAMSYQFINYDDQFYVTDNPLVQNGLTWSGIKWAFAGIHVSNWHPLTWLSHMADCDLFRLNPAGPHLVNILFHSANAGLLFALLFRLTNKLWPSAFVAALFAWHPLHVESVAWISERKDVLSTFFAFLTLWSYMRYAQENHRRCYWIAVMFYVMALLSKPMPVTLPVVMLLLDYWPLNRFEDYKLKNASVINGKPSIFNFQLSIIWEKWPFFLLAAVSCFITFLAQRDTAVSSLTQVPFGFRLENSVTAYTGYLIKMVWPFNLDIFYPLHAPIASQSIVESAIILTGISLIVWLERKINRCLIVGWLWFLITLLPVIGLVQIGTQAMADRYSYFPLIGIFLAIAFSAQRLVERFCFLKTWLAIVGFLIVAACMGLTERQLRYWHDSGSLFTHTLEVEQSDTAHVCLGIALEGENRPSEALTHFLMAWRLNPMSDLIHANIAKALDDEGKSEQAADIYREAVKRKPLSPSIHNYYGIVLMKLGRFDEAMEQFSTAAGLDVSSARPEFLIGKCLLKTGRDTEAMIHLHTALQRDSDNLEILLLMANVRAADQNPQARDGRDAHVLAERLVKLTDGKQPAAWDALAMAKAELGQFDEAVQIQQQAVKLIEATGPKEDIAAMQHRLELYQKQQPWRESFNQTLKASPPEKLSPQ